MCPQTLYLIVAATALHRLELLSQILHIAIMLLRSIGALTLALGGADAFKNSAPFFMLSTQPYVPFQGGDGRQKQCAG
jgi:hypothetical protein